MDEIVAVTPLRFGKVRYEKGAPKNAPKWIWACACEECMQRPLEEVARGPFRTRRDAERDAEQTLSLILSEPHGSA
jgi:hypothetical protein